MNNITIRVGKLDDLDSIAKLDSEVFGEHCYSLLVLRQMLEIGHIFLVAEVSDKEIAGYTVGALEAGKDAGWILALAVRKMFRSQGIASKLTSEIINILGIQQAACIFLTVSPENKTAVNLYQKTGFLEVRREPGYFGPGEDRIVMKKTVRKAI